MWNSFLHFGSKYFFPPIPLMACFTYLSVSSLIYIFTHGMENHPVSFVAYPLSAYTLIAICLILCKALPRRFRRAKEKVNANPMGHQYMTDAAFRVKVSLYISLTINLMYAAMKFTAGLWYSSTWLGALAIYYIVVSVLRFVLLRYMRGDEDAQELREEYKKYRLCGIWMLILNLSLTGIIFQMVWQNQGYRYPGFLVLVVAMYAFYAVSFSIVEMVKYRKYNRPVLLAAKNIRFATALVSLLTMETAMLAQFGEDAAFQQRMTALTGAGVCVIVLGMSVYMIVKANKELNRMSEYKM